MTDDETAWLFATENLAWIHGVENLMKRRLTTREILRFKDWQDLTARARAGEYPSPFDTSGHTIAEGVRNGWCL